MGKSIKFNKENKENWNAKRMAKLEKKLRKEMRETKVFAWGAKMIERVFNDELKQFVYQIKKSDFMFGLKQDIADTRMQASSQKYL